MLAGRAQTELRGLADNDLRLCAGLPDRAETATGPDGVQRRYWTYLRNPPVAAGVTVNVPVFGGVSISRVADCRATFEIVEGHVTRIGLTGAAELGPAHKAACASLVLGCMELLGKGPAPSLG